MRPFQKCINQVPSSIITVPELLIKDRRDIAVKPDFWGKIPVFVRGVTRKILERFF